MDHSCRMPEGGSGVDGGLVSPSRSPQSIGRSPMCNRGMGPMYLGTSMTGLEPSSPRSFRSELPGSGTNVSRPVTPQTIYSLPVSCQGDLPSPLPIANFSQESPIRPLPQECSADALLGSEPERTGPLSLNGVSSSPGSQSQSTRESGLSLSRRDTRLPKSRSNDYGDHYPDGGWGWVVCGGAFVAHFLGHGLHLAAGVLCQAIGNTHGLDTEMTIWLSSSCYGLSLLLWPLVTIICRRKSVRVVAMLGGLIAALAFLFMSFSYNLQQVAASMVVMSLGTGMMLCTASIITGRYFQRRRECAEMLILCGSGVGMAVLSVYVEQLISILTWERAMQGTAGLLLGGVIAGGLYRSATIYHPRRSAILYIRTMKMTKQQRRDFKNGRPYIDLSTLRMRSVQTLMLSICLISLGIHVPYLLLPRLAAAQHIDRRSVILLTVFLGVAFAFGSLITGLIVIRSSLRCMIARQYLCQIPSFACGLILLMFTMAEGFKSFAIFVWIYGLLCGAYVYSIKVYAYEQVTVKLMERGWSFLVAGQAIPISIGPPCAWYLNGIFPAAQGGIVFSATCMILGSLFFSCMPCASKHKSNNEVIQLTNLRCRTNDEYLAYCGLRKSGDRYRGHSGLSDATASASSSSQQDSDTYSRPDQSPWSYPGNRMPATSSDEERWSDIEAMSPMSPTDKVTEFLVHSQSIIQDYGEIQRMNIPNVRLEVKSEYVSNSDLVLNKEAIKDLKLEATVRRHSPNRKRNKSLSLSRDKLRESPFLPKAIRTKSNSTLEQNHKSEEEVFHIEAYDMTDNTNSKSCEDSLSPTVTTEKMTTV